MSAFQFEEIGPQTPEKERLYDSPDVLHDFG